VDNRIEFIKRNSEFRFSQYVDSEKNIYNLVKNPQRPRIISVNRASNPKSELSVEKVIQ